MTEATNERKSFPVVREGTTIHLFGNVDFPVDENGTPYVDDAASVAALHVANESADTHEIDIQKSEDLGFVACVLPIKG